MAQTDITLDGITFQTFDFPQVDTTLDGITFEDFDYPYVYNEIKGITFQDFGTGEFNPLLHTPKGVIVNRTPYNDIPQIVITSEGVFRKTNNNPRPKTLL